MDSIIFLTPTSQLAPISWPLGSRITQIALYKRIGDTCLSWLYAQLATNSNIVKFRDTVMMAEAIDLLDPDLANDLAYLASLSGSPFTASGNTAILTAPVQFSELKGT